MIVNTNGTINRYTNESLFRYASKNRSLKIANAPEPIILSFKDVFDLLDNLFLSLKKPNI